MLTTIMIRHHIGLLNVNLKNIHGDLLQDICLEGLIHSNQEWILKQSKHQHVYLVLRKFQLID